MKAEKAWGHDAFLDYCDRWMYEKLTPEQISMGKQGPNKGYLATEGEIWWLDSPFVKPMWDAYRAAPGLAPTDGWQKQHDDSIVRNAIAKERK